MQLIKLIRGQGRILVRKSGTESKIRVMVDEYKEAEKYLKRAVELMPDDPIVNDHYGDILWKLDQKIQARYFWNSVLSFDDTEDDMRENINKKLITGLKSIQWN